MKKIIFALSLFVSLNAFAGAYSLNCSNENGSVTIGNGILNISGTEYEYFGDDSTGLMGHTIVNFLKETRPKVVVSVPDADSNVAQGGVTILKRKYFRDECGHTGTETKFKEAVGIYQTDGKTLVAVARVKCTERIINGHCI